MFEANLDDKLLALMKDLKQGTFVPKPLRRVFLPKAPGQVRPLGIPAVRDRVAQEVLRRRLSPVFESRFHPDSFGFRPGRSAHDALDAVKEGLKDGLEAVYDADLKGYVDTIPHDKLMASVEWRIADGTVHKLIHDPEGPAQRVGARRVRDADDFNHLGVTSRELPGRLGRSHSGRVDGPTTSITVGVVR